MAETRAPKWQSGKLAGRKNLVLLGGGDCEITLLHVTDDGPAAKPGERYWCEYLDRAGDQQACMAPTLRKLLMDVHDGWESASSEPPPKRTEPCPDSTGCERNGPADLVGSPDAHATDAPGLPAPASRFIDDSAAGRTP